MTKEIKLGEQLPGGLLAGELKRIEETSVAAHLRSLENQALSISSAVAAQRAATDAAFVNVGQLFTDRMDTIANSFRSSIELAESSVTRAASAISLAHSASIAEAMRMHEASSAARAIQIGKAFEQVGGTLDLMSMHEQMRKSLDLTSVHEQMRKSLDLTSVHEQMRKSLDLRSVHEQMRNSLDLRSVHEQMRKSLDFTKQFETSARSIIESLNLQTGAATLNLRSMFEEVRASTAISMLATGQGGAAAALDLSAIREVVEEVVQRHVPKPGGPASPTQATSEGSVVPADYPWDALFKQLGWRALIVVLAIWALGTTIDAWWHVEVERWMNAHDPETRTEIVTKAVEDFGREYADGLRCTKANLNVRKDPSADAAIVGHLTAGQPVEVLEAQGPFSRIRYRDPGSDQLREGWAASGYLVKFVPPSARRKDKK